MASDNAKDNFIRYGLKRFLEISFVGSQMGDTAYEYSLCALSDCAVNPEANPGLMLNQMSKFLEIVHPTEEIQFTIRPRNLLFLISTPTRPETEARLI